MAERTAPDKAAGIRPAPATRRGEAALLSALVLVGVALRLFAWHRTPVMFNDGPRYLAQAAKFLRGDWNAGFADVYHPLYALAVAGVQWLFGPADPSPSDWETAAAAVSIAAGAGSIVALYFFVRSAFGPGVAWIGAGILAVHNYAVDFSSNVQSDGLYLAVFLSAVALCWSGLKHGRIAYAVWGGVFGGLAYLTRPEGLGVVGVAGACALGLALARRWTLPRLVGWAAALCVGTLVVAGPYVAVQWSESGRPTLTRKKSVGALAGVTVPGLGEAAKTLDPGAQVEFSTEMHTAVKEKRKRREKDLQVDAPMSLWEWRAKCTWDAIHTSISALRPELLAFAVVGIVWLGFVPGLRGGFVLGVLALYTVAVIALTLNYGYVSRRHTLPAVSLVMGYSAVGAWLVGGWLLGLGGRWLRALRSPPAAAAGALGLAILVAFALGKQLRPVSPGGLAERNAAEWLRETMNPAGPVAANRRRVAYYAGAPWFPLRKVPSRVPMGELLRTNGVRFVIAGVLDLDRYPPLADPDELGDRVIHRTEADGARALVYDLGEGG